MDVVPGPRIPTREKRHFVRLLVRQPVVLLVLVVLKSSAKLNPSRRYLVDFRDVFRGDSTPVAEDFQKK